MKKLMMLALGASLFFATSAVYGRQAPAQENPPKVEKTVKHKTAKTKTAKAKTAKTSKKKKGAKTEEAPKKPA